jgi:hypothetical protein
MFMSFESLSPQLSSIESLRSSIPEEHRKLFDSLQQDIKDYCKAHGLPAPSLSSREAFITAARKNRTPPDVLNHIIFLLKRFDYLTEHKKPIPPEQDPEFREVMEYANNLFNLSEQYRAQVSLLEHLLLVQHGVIVGGNNERYPVPPVESIARRLFERQEELEIKHGQGFTKLLLVPFALPLASFQTALETSLVQYRSSSSLPPFPVSYTRSDIPLTLAMDSSAHPDILYASDDPNYYGVFTKTKFDILREQASDPRAFVGWHVCMLQPSTPGLVRSPGFAGMPPRGEGGRYGRECPRPDIETGRSANDQLPLLTQAQVDETSPYFGERGMTPEDWFMAFLVHLQESGRFLDDEMFCFCLGSFFRSNGKIPACGAAQHTSSRFGVRLTFLSSHLPSANFGLRTLINI